MAITLNEEKTNTAKRKLKTIAGRLVRELEHKLPKGSYEEELDFFNKVLSQEKKVKLRFTVYTNREYIV